MKSDYSEEIISGAMKSILRSTDDFMFVKDKNFIYVGSSDSFAIDCAGHTSIDEIIGKNDFEIFADQNIAKKYRLDDEKMFAEKIDKLEFREEYPGKNGRKRYCITTKYLICDNEGNPSGIFGQCKDITEQVELEIINKNDINRKIANAFNSVFYATYFGDLENQSFTIMHGKEYAKNILTDCKNISEALERFIGTLVDPADAEKMREFCDISTLSYRLKNKSHIDCEYRGVYVDGWCQTSFVPVDYDENGELTHFLFVLSSVDQNKAKEIEEGISNKKNLEAIFDKVPGGIVMYRWDGKELKTLNISKYYADIYGYSLMNNGSPDFERIHPDDVKEYKQAIKEALTHTHSLEYVYRVWNEKKQRYLWTQVNAVSELQNDGTSLVYAMYSDVTKQKDAEILLGKKSASLVAALNASNQLCYEYDPELHTEECLTEDKIFNLPKVIENYPETMLEYVHPDDREVFLETIHRMDEGEKEANCNIRLKLENKYVWYAYKLHSIYDFEKERIIVLLSIIDNTEHVITLNDYEERMRTLVSVAGASLTLGTVNVTENTFSAVHARDEIKSIVERSETFDDIFKLTVDYVVGEQQKEEYRNMFSRQKLLEYAEKGQMKVQMDHLYRVGNDHLEWVRTCVDMLKNPQTGDITGVCYAKSIQEETIKDAILEKILETDYPVVAIIYPDSGEYYLFEKSENKYCTLMQDYWGKVREKLNIYKNQKEYKELTEFVTRENVMNHLEQKGEYVYTFDSMFNDRLCRIELRYTYADKVHGLIMMSIRNITDAIQLKKYKHDSEHDMLTDLLNRTALFEKCSQLMEKYPDQEFVMLHGDIKNFHLYNTFYGEEEGNKLLCEIAGYFNAMDEDYEYWAYGRIEADVFCAFFPYDEDVFRKHLKNVLNEIPKTHNDFLLEPNIGIYKVTDTSMPIEAMFNRATIAAKSNVKNLFGVISQYDEKMEQTLTDNQQILKEMNKAIEEEQFKVYLQPKYSLDTEEIVGSEALVRWIHPDHGMVSPGRFIPLFESNGFIVELDHYMWEHVCMVIRRWQDEGKHIYPVSVNVSRVSMYGQRTVLFLKNLINKYEINPEYLQLELTETAYMDDPEEIKIQLKELQEFGFKILMDDFGSGYSSLNTLRELPVDVLKLDMKFLTESSQDVRGNIVLSSVVRMSKLLGLPTVAEGVETREQAEYLRSLGCEFAQGYLFAKPMPLSEYEERLTEIQK